MPSIIIITYLVVLYVMLRLDCVIEVSHWGILRIEFDLFVFLLCWLVRCLFGGYSLDAVQPRWRGAGCLCLWFGINWEFLLGQDVSIHILCLPYDRQLNGITKNVAWINDSIADFTYTIQEENGPLLTVSRYVQRMNLLS